MHGPWNRQIKTLGFRETNLDYDFDISWTLANLFHMHICYIVFSGLCFSSRSHMRVQTWKNHRTVVRLPILSFTKSQKTTVPLREIAFFEPTNFKKPPCRYGKLHLLNQNTWKNHRAAAGNCIFWTKKLQKTTVPLREIFFFF